MEGRVRRQGFVAVLFALALVATSSGAQAAKKVVHFSLCAGSDCANNASQHNFMHPGEITLPTGLPSGIQIRDFTYACSAFCNHEALWPKIVIGHGEDGAHFTLDAHHVESVNESSRARATTLTIAIWIHY